MNFPKGSKRLLTTTPRPSGGPYLWKSCACISYYLALIPPCIYATISITKNLRGGVKGRLKFFVKFIRFGNKTLPLCKQSSIHFLLGNLLVSHSNTTHPSPLRQIIVPKKMWKWGVKKISPIRARIGVLATSAFKNDKTGLQMDQKGLNMD